MYGKKREIGARIRLLSLISSYEASAKVLAIASSGADYAKGMHGTILGIKPDTPCEEEVDSAVRFTALRVNCTAHNGPQPERTVICHKCDNGLCIRADHLFWGSRSDNCRDCLLKGRQPGKKPIGGRADIIAYREACCAKLGARLFKLLAEFPELRNTLSDRDSKRLDQVLPRHLQSIISER